jgi:SpoIID/LytB domain protein
VTRRWLVALLAMTSLVVTPQARQAANAERAAWRIIDLSDGRVVETAHDERLERPVQPGSFMKVPSLIAALASRTISSDTRIACEGQATIDGRVIRCSHPRVRHALRPSEALALSCNVYFATMAQRLPRARLDGVLTALGLPATPSRAPIALAATGLDGTPTSPIALLNALSRVVLDPAAMRLDARSHRVVLDGLRGSAVYGTSSAFALKGVAALAKTGTSDAPGGGVQGLVAAVWPADRPARGIVLIAPGAAGMDAADLAAQLAARNRNNPTNLTNPTNPTNPGNPQIRVGSPRREGGYAITAMPLEEYVARVLGGEAAPASGAAALEALAITARTFVLANRGRHRRDGFDMCTLTHCQVLRDPTPAMRAAVTATAGRVLEWKSAPASVFYTASCGGFTERPSAVWPGAEDPPFLRAHRDGACDGQPRWAAEIPVRDVQRALASAGFRGTLRDVSRRGRTGSGRVEQLKLEGLSPAAIAATDFRTLVGRVLGWHLIKSTDFTVRRRSGGFYFEGHGFGHGVGLCVLGSVRRAARGDSAADILKAYFPGLKIATSASLRLAPVAAAPPAAPIAAGEPVAPDEIERPAGIDRPAGGVKAPPPQPPLGGPDAASLQRPLRPAFELVLPPSAEPNRTAIEAMVARELDAMRTATKQAVPAELRIVFHPSPASFQRETGESWWSAARTRGARIDLQPPNVLRDRGTLETTLRHELAHIMTAPVVAGRAEWVKEGAAMHFAGEPPPQSVIGADGIPRRTHCPSDAELQRPASAALARQAYGRAAACFERALVENGGRWQEVR